MRSQVRVLLAASAMLSGCSMVPAYRQPAVPLPARFSQGLGDPVAPASQWWTSFGSGELTALEARAIAGNNDLQAAAARIDEARAQARIAAAPLLPTLSAVGDVSGTTGAASARGGRDAGRSGYDALAEASYEIDFWGRNRALAGSGRALAHASAFDRETVATTLTATVANTYFLILSLDERLTFARQIARDARRVLGLIEAQHEVGTATVLQIEQQTNIVATFEGQVPALAQQRETALHALATLTGGTTPGLALTATSLTGLILPEVAVGLPSTLLERRPDVRAAEARLIAANFDVGAARAAFFPSIALTGQGGLASGSLAKAVAPIGIASGAASLLQPLFDGGRRAGQLRYDKAHGAELAAGYRQTVLTAFQDVEDGLSATHRLAQQATAAEKADASAKHAAELSEAQFKLGVIDLLTLIDSQRAYFQAQDALLRIRLLRLQAVVSLYRALGGGFDAPADATQVR